MRALLVICVLQALCAAYCFRFAPLALTRKTTLRMSDVLDEGALPVDESALEESADDAMIRRLSAEIWEESGVELDQLINPSKVVNLERDLMILAEDLAASTSAAELEEIQAVIDKKTTTLFIEKRSVMRGWLKGLFVGQSVLAGAASFAMVYDAVPGQHLPLVVQVLGFWMWWLFIIPSLRARKPQAAEKEALNIAFIASPLASIIAPSFTKDAALIWWLNALVTAACYGYGYATIKEGSSEKSSLPDWLNKGLKALDYGSGKERGTRN